MGMLFENNISLICNTTLIHYVFKIELRILNNENINIYSYTHMVYVKGPSYTYMVYETEKLVYLYCIRKSDNVLTISNSAAAITPATIRAAFGTRLMLDPRGMRRARPAALVKP